MLLLGYLTALAQAPPKNPKDFLKIKTPDIQYVTPDTSYLHEDEIKGEDVDNEYNQEVDFNVPEDLSPRKELPLMAEDTSTINEGEYSIVEVEEQVKFDSIWVKIAEYYSIWDSRTVNPYRVDGTTIDSVPIILYDTLIGRNWAKPLKTCRMTSDFGFRRIRWHYGIDLDLDIGDSIFAAFDGVVRIKGWDRGGYGNYVVLRHYNGLETVYGHMTRAAVVTGTYVKAGELIGYGGSTGRSTGPHLHFEIRYAGNPIDPKFFYDFSNCELRFRTCLITNQNFNYQKQARLAYFHTIRSGDSLGKLARRYGVPVSRLCRLNGISTKTKLRIGRKLRIR